MTSQNLQTVNSLNRFCMYLFSAAPSPPTRSSCSNPREGISKMLISYEPCCQNNYAQSKTLMHVMSKNGKLNCPPAPEPHAHTMLGTGCPLRRFVTHGRTRAHTHTRMRTHARMRARMHACAHAHTALQTRSALQSPSQVAIYSYPRGKGV